MPKMTKEIEAMASISGALDELEKDEALRVLHWLSEWANSRFELQWRPSGPPSVDASRLPAVPKERGELLNEAIDEGEVVETNDRREIPGVAIWKTDGSFAITLRDPKAKSTNDAAIRLAHIAIYAYCKLSGESAASSKTIVVPVLKKWRAYDGNTRPALSRHKGIQRQGDSLSLDAHSEQDAQGFIRDVLNSEILGEWKPKTSGGSRKPKKSKPVK